MPASNATTGYGLGLTFNGAQVDEATNVDGPSVKRDMVEVTNLLSPGAFKEFIGALIDGGEISCKVNYKPQSASHQAILANLNAVPPQPKVPMTVIYTDSGAGIMSCNVLVQGFTGTASVAGGQLADLSFKVTGPVTFAT